MGADVKKLRARIKSVDSTLHLTKAMGLVASSKIRRASERMQLAKQYENALKETVEKLSSFDDCAKSPYMKNSGEDKTLLVVVAGDRGLAGGYNANIFRLLKNYEGVDIIPIGKRACDKFFKKTVRAEHFTYADAKVLAEQICIDFVGEKYNRVGILCTKYHSIMSQEAYVKWLLPLTKTQEKSAEGVIFEPDEVTVLNSIIPEYVAGTIISCVKESFASEVAARRVAMDSAGKNANEMLADLGLKYNRARQGSITQEITEIVAGSGS
jgi:F-type H+-transporting ATPase subunit gamma